MAASEAKIGGLVLVAAGSRQFGGGKLVAELHGRPLLDHALDSIRGVPAIGRIVVVFGGSAQEVAAAADLGELETMVSEHWHEGISASLRTGLEALSECGAVLITLGDQPFITPSVISSILDELERPSPQFAPRTGDAGAIPYNQAGALSRRLLVAR